MLSRSERIRSGARAMTELWQGVIMLLWRGGLRLRVRVRVRVGCG